MQIHDSLQHTLQHLQRDRNRLEEEQLELRVELAQRTREQDQRLFTARRVNGVIQAQLGEANAIIGQKNEHIAELERQLHIEMVEKNGLITQIDELNDQVAIDQNAINDLQFRLGETIERIHEFEQEVIDERIRNGHQYRLIRLEGEERLLKERLKSIRTVTYNGGSISGAILGGIFLGPLGALLGCYVGIGAGGLGIQCSAKPIIKRLIRVEEEIKSLHEHLET